MKARLGSMLILVWICAGTASARADSLEQVFQRGNEAFARGDHESALSEYERLLEAGVDDPVLAFNLASTYGALGRYGQAIRFFERSLLHAPRDEQAEAGLRRAREALGERQAAARGEAIVVDQRPLTEAIYAFLTADTLALLLIVFAWLSAGLALALFVVRAEALRLVCGIGAVVSLALGLFALLGVAVKADWGRDGRRAIVVRENVALREGPDERASLAAELSEGEVVRIVGQEGRFTRVLARGERSGFVLRESVGEI